MSEYIKLELYNFMIHKNITITLNKGLNSINGKIGSGKSTIIRAIYFCLYGGRKFQDVANDNNKNDKTYVNYHYISNNLKYTITRTRPSEKLYVTGENNGNRFNLDSNSAQDFINKLYGSEDNFISSCFIQQKRNHFIMDSSNADKLKLIQEITFGDMLPCNQSQFYLQKLKVSISNIKSQLNDLSNKVSIQHGIIDNIIKTNNMDTSFQITEENNNLNINKLNELIKEYDYLNSILPKVKLTRELKIMINQLKLCDVNLSEIDNEISQLKKIKLKNQYTSLLKDFDEDVFKYDKDLIMSCNILYNYLFSNGLMSIKDIDQFIDKINKDNDNYDEFIKNKKEYDRIVKEMNEKIKINECRLKEYKINKEKHIISTKDYKNFIKEKDEIIKSISENTSQFINYEFEEICYNFYTYVNNYCVNALNEYNKFLKYNDLYKDFDKDVITCDRFALNNDSKIYSTLNNIINLKTTSLEEIHEFIKKEKDNYDNIIKNKNYENMNKNIEYNNSMLLKEYNRKCQEIDQYIDKLSKLDSLIEKIDEFDDLSIEYLYNEKRKYDDINNQHICPNCNYGLYIKNGQLYKGNVDSVEKETINNKINKYYNTQLKYRNDKKLLLSSNIDLNKPDKPILQDLYKLVETFNPKITYFDYPKYEYNKFCSLTNSLNLYDGRYKEYLTLKDKEYKNIELYDEYIKICKKRLSSLNRNVFSSCNLFPCFINNKLSITECINNEDIISSFDTLDKNIELELDIYKRHRDLNRKLYYYNYEPVVYPDVDEPELFEITEVQQLVEVKKPTLKRCKKPELEYNKTKSLIKSLELIDTYNKNKELDIDSNLVFDENRFNYLIEYKNKVEYEINKKKDLEKHLKNSHEDDPDIENKISKLKVEIDMNNTLINKFKIYQSYIYNVNLYNQYKQEYDKCLYKISQKEFLYKHIENQSKVLLQRKLDDVNYYLSLILNKLFNNDIEIKISSTHQLKDNSEKFQISFDVIYKGNKISKLERLSGGEENIVSLALLLSFSRLNCSKILMIDEVMASLDNEMREKCLNVIKEWTVDKFVINVCHELSNIYQDNIIELKNE